MGAILLSGWVGSLVAAPPVVTNVVGVQRPGTKLVDITYDLADPDTAAVAVSLEISADAGVTWTVPVAGSTGQVGSGITVGLGKKIVWDAGANWNNQVTTTMRYRVTAEDAPVYLLSDEFNEATLRSMPEAK